jgi:single-stranded-DNA-specific exonuclease
MDWIEPRAVEVPTGVQEAIGGHPLIAQTLVRRGITGAAAALAFLDPRHYTPASPFDLPDMERAAERVERAIRDGEQICVWGDFDVDGQTSAALLVSTLRDLGGAVTYHIPHRERESHGVGIPALEARIAEGAQLILTCDTGITAHAAVETARERGVDVVVTDHHDLPPRLPGAHAVVNPKRLPEGHPMRELPGVGCAYELAEALYRRAGRAEEAARHLDLVALGIVADVAVQVGDTRYLLQRGLEVLRRTEREGLRALMEVAQLDPTGLTEEHIAFGLGPRINALGRLADAREGVELLMTRDRTRARTLAAMLEGLNARRKLLCDQVMQGAEAQIAHDPSLLEDGVLVLSHARWPAGVIGIVAGRLAERYDRPVVLLSAPPGGPARGSARSVDGCDIHAAIAAHGDMLIRFGGHPMAAGLSLEAEHIPAFRRALARTAAERFGERPPRRLVIDGYVPLSDLSLELVAELERLAPFGAGNPPLTLATRDLSLLSTSTVGRDDAHLLLTVEDETGFPQRVIWWNGNAEALPEGRFDLAYVVRTNDYRGQREIQLEWVDAREREPPPRVVPVKAGPTVVDCRQEPHPRQRLEAIRAQGDGVVWAEAGERAAVGGCDRRELRPAEVLVMWTIPPGPRELQAAVERVDPRTVYVFANDPGLDALELFLKRLAGLVRHALVEGGGQVSLRALAAATAQRETAVRVGLEWLEARSHAGVEYVDEDTLQLSAGGAGSAEDAARLKARLEGLLAESAAYRAHFRRVKEAAHLLRV